jgi:hypothetical protein
MSWARRKSAATGRLYPRLLRAPGGRIQGRGSALPDGLPLRAAAAVLGERVEGEEYIHHFGGIWQQKRKMEKEKRKKKKIE